MLTLYSINHTFSLALTLFLIIFPTQVHLSLTSCSRPTKVIVQMNDKYQEKGDGDEGTLS